MSDECSICSSSLCPHGLCTDTGSPWTDGCPNSRGANGYQCQNCAESQYEQFLSDYYGGDSSFSESHTDQMARLRQEKDGRMP